MKHRVSNRGAKLLAHILAVCLLLSLVAPGLSVGATQATPETVPAAGAAGGVEAAQEEVQSEGVSVTPIDGSAVSAELAMGQETALPEDAIDLQAPYAADEAVRVVIVMEEKPVLEAGFSTQDLPANFPALCYRLSLVANQAAVVQNISRQALDGEALTVNWNLTIAMNAISATVEYGQIEKIQAVDGVAAVYLDRLYALIDDTAGEETAQPMTAASNGMMGSYAAWETGYSGAGQRIAIIDTGIDTDHDSFRADAFLYSLEATAAEAGKTVDGYALLDAEEIARVLPLLNAYARNPEITGESVYVSEKIAYGFNYVLNNEEVDNDAISGDHGTHVAGIASANRYVPAGDGTFTTQANGVVGAAPDAQLLAMKVFSNGTGAYASDYIAAIEDALLLGADAINLSLGSSSATGFTYSGDEYFDGVFDALTQTDTVVTISAGNRGTWAEALTETGLLYAEDAGEATVGSPGSYDNSLAVASVTNAGFTGQYVRFAGTLDVVYTETSGYGNAPFASLATEEEGTEYDYVLIDGIGVESDYDGLDVTGKIVLVSRGETDFAEKVNIAAGKGAVGVIVYNNTSGYINMDLTGVTTSTPAVSISQREGEAVRAVSTQENGVYTGKVLVCRGLTTSVDENGYTMSDFSSWGPTGDLTIKPEITAPGGNIYSTFDGSTYGLNSGTSMAAPGAAGAAALVLQYIRETGLAEGTGLTDRALAQSLLMATASPLTDPATGLPYPVRQQGAGLINAYDAITAEAYLLVGDEAENDGKVKLELGDDPDRTGVYSFAYTLYNLTQEDQTYRLDALVTAPDVVVENGVAYQSTANRALSPAVRFTADGMALYYDVDGDGEISRLDAQALLNYVAGKSQITLSENQYDLNQDGILSTADVRLYLDMLAADSPALQQTAVRLPAGGSVTVTGQITLSQADREYLETNFVNGSYVEGFVQAKATDGVDLSIPLLAFYGNWTDPSMFEKATHVGNGVFPPENAYFMTKANYFILNIDGSGFYFPFGNLYAEDAEYLPERSAVSSTARQKLDQVYFSLLRNAAYFNVTMEDADTGEVYLTYTDNDIYGAAVGTNGGLYNYSYYMSLGYWFTDAAGNPLPDGTRLNFRVTALPEYYLTEDGALDETKTPGKGASFGTTTVVVDNTAPVLEQANAITELVSGQRSLELTVSDNRYVAALQLFSANGNTLLQNVSPNQTELGTSTTTTLQLPAEGNRFVLGVGDYAGNASFYTLELGGAEEEIPNDGRLYVFNRSRDDLTWAYFYPEELVNEGPEMHEAAAAERVYVVGAYCGGYVYAVDEDQVLYAIDPITFEETYVRKLAVAPSAMAYDPVSETMYALDAQRGLYTLDPMTGEMEQIYTFTESELPAIPRGLAVDSDGTFYVATLPPYGGDSLIHLYSFTWDGTVPEMGKELGTAAVDTSSTTNREYTRVHVTYDPVSQSVYFVASVTENMLTSDSNTPVLYAYQKTSGSVVTVGNIGAGRFSCLYAVDDGQAVQAPTGITLDESALTIVKSQQKQLTAAVVPWNSDRSVTWSSSDEAVATVDGTGLVTGTGAGTCTITAASAVDPTLSANCTVVVTEFDVDMMAFAYDSEDNGYWASYTLSQGLQKLADSQLEVRDATMLNGVIYAITAEGIYTVDRNTFAETQVASNTYNLSHITYTPNGYLIGYCDSRYIYYLFDTAFTQLGYVFVDDWSYPGAIMGLTSYDGMDNNYAFGFGIDQNGDWYNWGYDTAQQTGGYATHGWFYANNAPSGNTYSHDFRTTQFYRNAMCYDPVSGYAFYAFKSGNTPAHMELFKISQFVGTTGPNNMLQFVPGSYVEMGEIGDDVSALSALFNYSAVTVTYAGAGIDIPAERVRYGETFTQPEDPVREGWDFGGWYTDPACTLPYDFATPATADITLYAKWTIAEGYCQVSFQSNGGSAVNPAAVLPGNPVERPDDPTLPHHHFVEWCVDEELTTPWDFTQPVTESMTLYAKWQIYTYTVTFETNGGSPVPAQVVDWGSTATEPEPPTKEGYTFDGWYTNTALTRAYNFDRAVTSDLTLYARWHENILTEVYLDELNGSDDNDGSRYYPVRTFEKAKSLLAGAETNTITIRNSVFITGNETWDLTGYEGAVVKAGDNCSVRCSAGSSLTLKNIILDGGNTCSYFVYVYRGTLTLDQGAVIQNCRSYAIEIGSDNASCVTLKGGVIQNNGGESLNGVAREGEVPSVVLAPTAGTELSISGDLNLKNSSLSSNLPMQLTIAGSLDNLTLPDGALYLSGYLTDGDVVAVPGEGYTITQADLDKLKLRDETLTLVLEDGNVVVRTAAQGEQVQIVRKGVYEYEAI